MTYIKPHSEAQGILSSIKKVNTLRYSMRNGQQIKTLRTYLKKVKQKNKYKKYSRLLPETM